MAELSPGILDIDMGNTRIKWRLCRENGECLSGAVSQAEDNPWCDLAPAEDCVRRVRVASVAGAVRNRHLAQWVKSRWEVTAEFAATQDAACGVTNSYSDPARMGVDRWLAMVAAYQLVQGACLVVDCGSAVTVEVVDDGGQHHGGYIVPGLRLMRRALFEDTDAVKVDAAVVPRRLLPGKDTASAVNCGLPLMVLGLIDRGVEQLRQLSGYDKEPLVIVTGGDAESLLPHLRGRSQIERDLVLDGLALVLP